MIGPRHAHKTKAKNALLPSEVKAPNPDDGKKTDSKVNGKKSKRQDSDSDGSKKRRHKSPSRDDKKKKRRREKSNDKKLVKDNKPVIGYVWTGSLDTEDGRDRESSPDSNSSRRKSVAKKVKEDKKSKKADKSLKKEKEFAWMDSDESESGSGAGSDSGEVPKVPLEKVETLSQMARIAPNICKKLKDDELRPKELSLVCVCAAKTKFFDGGLFECLYPAVRKACKKAKLGEEEVVEILCALSSLNAYNSRVFEALCATLAKSVASLDNQEKDRLKAALQAVNHNPGTDFVNELSSKKALNDGRALCLMFVRGQCKWGGRCKQSHDMAKMERIDQEKWKGLNMDNKSGGFKQSADLFKMDKRGALW
eukprot:gnl/MRDRNA2_/MRDRNA2_110867_c0_seq1.p1 gnl/MRDRNA2_/MRDRNA2_110867_c0~~gnl/MRDRNA2_/MRDRNA2_110867_c0_seq1.p1  ORF type:complete len:366 (+),score=97.98 gnl/MRDRNA2_/MRDRNA2_110867_c0_seq1:199-1296(+)